MRRRNRLLCIDVILLRAAWSYAFLTDSSTLRSFRQTKIKTGLSDSLRDQFCDLFAESLSTKSFTGFTLHGPKTSDDPVDVRGRIKRVQGRPLELKKKSKLHRCVQVTFKFHGATDVAKNYDEQEVLEDVVRPLLNGKSVVDSEWGLSVDAEVGATPCGSIQGGRIETLTKVYEYHAGYGKKQRLISRTQKSNNSSLTPTTLAHDRTKNRPLPSTDVVWSALGLTASDGSPKPGKKAKLAQAQKFVEIVSHLIEQHPLKEEQLRIFDMGCGRGYLTFALHAHLIQSERRLDTFGIDVRPKLVKDMNDLANSLNFTTLSFLQGTIEQYMVTTAEPKEGSSPESLKVWLALHACDTATDDALWSGIVQQADIIVVAPCCHKELRPQLDRAMPLPEVLRHGIFRQRWSATLTDAMRVMLLEIAGYQVQVLEFVQTADTPQNVMITAVKDGSTSRSHYVDVTKEKLVCLARSHGVEHQALATWMGISLYQDITAPVLQRQMPPL